MNTKNSHSKKYCIFGTGGFGREALVCLMDSVGASPRTIGDIAVFMVDDSAYDEPEVMGVPVIKRSVFSPEQYQVVVAIGEPSARKRVVGQLPPDTRFTTIIHPSAVISPWVDLAEGCIVTAGTVLTCNITIGRHAHLNLHTTIGHDCKMGDFFTTAPAVNISGNCQFGNGVYFGTNASVRQGVSICDDVTVGMGGVAVKDIKESGVYIGNPLVRLR
ncbi:acetyltransferase [Kistimonas scapharcae]|uniref:Acetyltransferase n=1 Tax=Kistimonas scapharcae TaxID=1036133 RepID=A0ABP8V6D4_9GAMM